ncbi:hypothetical protein [Microcoleus sp. F4-D5]|uniref:hypothetical protein n=1 Tax=Microcoleus sp. F4-D5 TaxID=2818760 RepID=UPI002FD0A764
MEDRSRKFHWKYLISWLILGTLGGLVMFILTKTSSLTIVLSIAGTVLLSVSFAGLGMLSEAWSAYNWQFGNIEHSPWVWYIYPLAVVVRMVINVWFVIIFRNPFSK